MDTISNDPHRINTIPETVQPERNRGLVIAARAVWFVALVLVALLAVRFIFILFGANPSNGFVNFIYNVSYPFARPFFGIFGYSAHYGLKRVESASLVGIAVYLIAAYLIVRLLTIPRTTGTAGTETRL